MFESAKIDVIKLRKLPWSSEINVREPSVQMFNFLDILHLIHEGNQKRIFSQPIVFTESF